LLNSSKRFHRESILIATLGAEPQVVTATLDLLRVQGETISKTIVLHTCAPDQPIQAAIERLRQDFEVQDSTSALELVPLCDEQGRMLLDVETPQETQAAFRFLYQQIQTVKMAGFRVHLLIASGRKTLALFGMSAAQLLFDEDDRLWHLYSAGDYLASKRMHPQAGDEVHLIPIPVILWSQVSPAMTGLSQVADPFEAVERVRKLQLAEKMDLARSFVLGALTHAEESVVRLLVREGLSDQEIAGRLSLSPRTVEQHLRAAYRKAADHWELSDVSRAGLVSLLNIYYLMGRG
jgi:CRISPR-associated Csx14 family protein